MLIPDVQASIGSPVESPLTPAVVIEPEAGLLAELSLFVREEKRWVVAPMLVVLTGLSVVLVAAEGAAIAPFIYALF